MKQLAVLLLLAISVWPAYGQSTLELAPTAPASPTYDGPPAPSGSATVSRDDRGHVAARAVRVTAPLRIDGQLDESLYREYTPMSDFVQNDPQPGAAATERTEVWVAFDADNVYVSVRAWESQPDRMIVNEMRRDSPNIRENENIGFTFDTFYDKRNSVVFGFNPLGGRADGQNGNEGQYNGDWNPVWEVKIARFDGGWTAEAAVPFKSLRYQSGVAGRSQLWGFNVRRINRWKNEVSYLSRVPDGTGSDGLLRVSQAATLVGLEAPAGSRTFDVKPYAISDVTTDRAANRRNDPGADFGFDGRYTLTDTLTADFTYHTDFAQVESDEQQVNLTRFNLFFPEKREFFLENLGVFNFAGATQQAATEVPLLFYSRRIGLDQGALIPINGGGRVTGKVGRYTVGLINMQTGDNDALDRGAANFSVGRLRADILRKSSVGVMYTRRTGDRRNDAYGADARFGFYDNVVFNFAWARTNTPGLTGRDTTHRAQLDYNGDRFGLVLHRVGVGANFNPEIGYVRRWDSLRHVVRARFSPRPSRIPSVRKFTYEAEVNFNENWTTGMLESRMQVLRFGAEFQTSDEINIDVEKNYEGFLRPFNIARGVIIPPGGYDLRTYRFAYTLGQQRRAAGKWMLEVGPFYDGNRFTFGYSLARVNVTPQLAVEPGFSVNKVNLPYGDFTATVINNRVTYTMTPLMFVSGLVQYNSNSRSLGANVRFRWEYRPASELFVVFNEGRNTASSGFPEMQNRSIVVKVNRLLRF